MKTLFYIFILTLPQIALAQLSIGNPLKSQTFGELVVNVFTIVRNVAIPFAAVAIIIVGFQLVTSAKSGNAEGTAKAKKSLIWVLVGSAIIVGAEVIARVVVNFAEKL